MEVQAPSPQTTLLIVLGASAWPFMPEFQRSEAFANAARRLKAYFLNPRPFGLPTENLLDLFDADKSADELDIEIGQFLERRLAAMKATRNPARDLLLYFIGHAGFVGRDSDFYLAIGRTRMDNPRASGLQMVSLAYTLTERARYLRRIIILDCCFAAAAFSAFQAGPDQVALQKTRDAFQVGRKAVGVPTKGTTLLCSSNHRSPSLLLPDSSSTMFTKAFLDALIQGTPSQQDRLTLRDVRDVAADFLSELRNAPKPEVHSPDQSEGDVADIPFFPNPRTEEGRLHRAEKERHYRAEEERARQAEEDRLRRTAASFPNLPSLSPLETRPMQPIKAQVGKEIPSPTSQSWYKVGKRDFRALVLTVGLYPVFMWLVLPSRWWSTLSGGAVGMFVLPFVMGILSVVLSRRRGFDGLVPALMSGLAGGIVFLIFITATLGASSAFHDFAEGILVISLLLVIYTCLSSLGATTFVGIRRLWLRSHGRR